MDVGTALLVFCVGAAALAWWIDLRFPRLGPADVRGALIRLVLALALGQLAAPAMTLAVESGASPAAALIAVALPALTLLFLAILWVFRALHGAVAGAR